MSTTKELTKSNTCGTKECFRTPEYTVRNDEHDYVAEVALPGVPKENVDINVDDGVLTVTGRRKNEVPESWKPLSRELSTANYRLKLELNAPIDTSKISGKVEDGILTLTLPLREAAKPRVIKVD